MIDSIKIGNSCLSDYSNIAQVIIGLITLIVGFLTFRLAMRVHKEFSKNHVKSKQVEKMSELTEFLNNIKIYLTFTDFYEGGGSGGTSYGIYYNVFEIGNLLNNKSIHELSGREIDFSDYDDSPVFLDKSSLQVMDIKKFIDSAFVPKEIADSLFNFFVSFTSPVYFKDLTQEETSIVVLNSSENTEYYDSFKQTNCEALKSWLNFKTHSNNLMKLVSKWFIDKGITDFNIRLDYKNIKN